MEKVDRALIERVRAAMCVEINTQLGGENWSVAFNLTKVAEVAAREATIERVEA